MNLQCKAELAAAYKSGSQIARVLTEEWCLRELYCPACLSDQLSASKVNTPAIDFVCPECDQLFQLKSLKNWNPKKIVDAGYYSMLRSIRADKVPNLLILQYSVEWLVRNLLLVPRFFLSESAIERRKPLAPHARRAGWVGCNILLGQIPVDGKIAMVAGGLPVPKRRVRNEFERTRSLTKIPPSVRGWTLDVLSVARRLRKPQFTLKDVYEFENELQASHPGNHNVRAKIRQQLQVLRDVGLAEFIGKGRIHVTRLARLRVRLGPTATAREDHIDARGKIYLTLAGRKYSSLLK
jgi:type II restriction enzyme